jgi:hypothetical protein
MVPNWSSTPPWSMIPHCLNKNKLELQFADGHKYAYTVSYPNNYSEFRCA